MSIEIGQDTCRWYVVRTHPKQEERADSNLRAWGVETMHPRLKARRLNAFSGAPTVTTRPLFPRYIFAKFNAREQLAKVSFTRGVNYVVSFGGQPVSIEEDIIQIVKDRIDETGFVRLGDDLKQGDKVVIKAGPLREFEGIFERKLKDNERITLLLTTISYQGRLVINGDLIERIC